MSHCWACVGKQVQSGSMFLNIMFNIAPCSKIDLTSTVLVVVPVLMYMSKVLHFSTDAAHLLGCSVVCYLEYSMLQMCHL